MTTSHKPINLKEVSLNTKALNERRLDLSFINSKGKVTSFEPFKLADNKNEVALAPSGKGMSFLSNKLMLEAPDPKLCIIDIGASYKSVCEKISGAKQVEFHNTK